MRAGLEATPPSEGERGSGQEMGDVAINVLRGLGARRQKEAENGIAIGDSDEIVASCPACGRPLDGTILAVCPGCGTRLLLGVPARKAGVFTVFGAVAGLLVGGLLIGAFASMARPATVPAAAAGGGGSTSSVGSTSSEGSTGSGGSPSNGQTTRPPTIPSTSLAALRQTVTINKRMLASVPALEAQAAEQKPDANAIAATLRAIAAEAASGSDITTRIVFWKDAVDLKTSLQAFYGSVRATAREGLAASLNNAKAYKIAAKRMLAVLTGVGAIDGQTQEVAGRSGVVVPTALPGPPG